jgi:hypothetical protein
VESADLAELEEVLAGLWSEAVEGDDARRLIMDAQIAFQEQSTGAAGVARTDEVDERDPSVLPGQ